MGYILPINHYQHSYNIDLHLAVRKQIQENKTVRSLEKMILDPKYQTKQDLQQPQEQFTLTKKNNKHSKEYIAEVYAELTGKGSLFRAEV